MTRRYAPAIERGSLSNQGGGSPTKSSAGRASMTRQLLSFVSVLCLLALLPASDASALDLPVRKAGLWEMKVLRTGSPAPDMTMQHCTDESTDKEMSTAFSPMGKEMCSKQDIQKTATGYVSDSVCGIAGMSITSHAEITGDFNSAYTVKSTAHSERGPTGVPRDSTTTIEAKWLGACKPDQKPGDIVMPGGMKMNIKDMEKLKGMIPKQTPK
jgi:hypothetical protein